MVRILVDRDEMVHLAGEAGRDADEVRALAISLATQLAENSLTLLTGFGINIGELLGRLTDVVTGEGGLPRLAHSLESDAGFVARVWRAFDAADGVPGTTWPLEQLLRDPLGRAGGWKGFLHDVGEAFLHDAGLGSGGIALGVGSRLVEELLHGRSGSGSAAAPSPTLPGMKWQAPGGGPAFTIGPATRPPIGPFDDDFPYDPKAKPSFADYKSRAKWEAKLRGAQLLRPDLADATRMYDHYLHGDGSPMTVDLDKGYRQDASIRTAVDDQIANSRAAADQLIHDSGLTSFSITGTAVEAQPYPVTENWQKTLGGYTVWDSADVRVDGDQVTMTVTVHEEDRWNFNHNAQDIATGAPDDENGRFEQLGWAHSFDTHGTLVRTVTWTLGDPGHSAPLPDDPDRQRPGSPVTAPRDTSATVPRSTSPSDLVR
ncbi:hypothetical protein I6A60_13965 [Frankia sp. AgB1.9]|uniref:hypothetical protein n=1 Tax=unclassified Frankia TaxID=2632575 RepID=UPI0019336671|nr:MULTISPECIES: hypothetical protein [unclassified Frankia]MBL7492284.1 hypothetical protein [Frankia sp. AgW1.1]MBL7548976.1 hypothetical protein [Frankia sp. AgB1.9]MBL7622574.1 hypothetical protein [Frankia sp. AgB1.8]